MERECVRESGNVQKRVGMRKRISVKERERVVNESDFFKSVSGRFEPTTPA